MPDLSVWNASRWPLCPCSMPPPLPSEHLLFSATVRGPRLVLYFACPTLEAAVSPRSPASLTRAVLQKPRSGARGIRLLFAAFEQKEHLAPCSPSQRPAPVTCPSLRERETQKSFLCSQEEEAMQKACSIVVSVTEFLTVPSL